MQRLQTGVREVANGLPRGADVLPRRERGVIPERSFRSLPMRRLRTARLKRYPCRRRNQDEQQGRESGVLGELALTRNRRVPMTGFTRHLLLLGIARCRIPRVADPAR